VTRQSKWVFLASLARRVLVYELRIWQSLYRWIFRRSITRDAGAVTFGYASLLTPILIAFIAVSAIEIPVVHLLMPWETIRRVFLGLGVWGVIWMIGLLASLRIYPHDVGEKGLRVRYSFNLDVTLPWDVVAQIRTHRRSLPSGRKVQLERLGVATTLNVAISSTTNVEVALRQPTPVRLPNGEHIEITALHFYADEPRALVTNVREHLAQNRPAETTAA